MASVSLYDTDFESAIARNKRNTVLLFVVLLLIGAVMGYVLGWGIAILQLIWTLPPDQIRQWTVGGVLLDLVGTPRSTALIGAALLCGAGLSWGLITLFSGERILASFTGARLANPEEPVERRFIDVVAEMAIAAGLPPPTAMVIDTDALNAFASGFSPDRAIITATSGILRSCTRDELQGVIGHEMGHIADYDVRYTTVVAAMAGILVLISHSLGAIARGTFGWGPQGGGYYPSAPRRSSGGGNSDSGSSGLRLVLTLAVLAVLIVVLIVAPLAARLVQMAISRQREFLADATSAKLTRNPVGLIHALQRLASNDTAIAGKNSPVAALCIAEPKGRSLRGLLSTHPELDDRIMRLSNMGARRLPGEVLPTTEHDSAPDRAAGEMASQPFLQNQNIWTPPSDPPPDRRRKGPWG